LAPLDAFCLVREVSPAGPPPKSTKRST
jgi:hypothetical protein